MRKKKIYIWLGVVGLIFVLVLIRVHHCTKMYKYDVTKNWEYDFSHTKAVILNLSMNDGKLDLPDKCEGKQVFLALNVKASFLGRIIQPSIHIVGDKSKVSYAVEQKVSGVRYIDISAFVSTGQMNLFISGDYLKKIKNKVQIIVLNSIKLKKKRILILSPHPDDAEIAAFGVYAENATNTFIVTITAGESGSFKYDEVYANRKNQFVKKGQLRVWNSLAVPLLGGVPTKQILNLGFFDGTLTEMFNEKKKNVQSIGTGISNIQFYRNQNFSPLAKGLSGEANWNSLVSNLAYLLKEIKPDIIITPYPALDKHPDHKLTTIALIEAIKQIHLKEGLLFLYSNHYVQSDYYPFGLSGSGIVLPAGIVHGIYFNSLYVYPLLENRQKDKIFALESMNDLRPDTEWRFVRGALKQLNRNIRTLWKGNKSYYRRAIHNGELFFVIDLKEIYNTSVLKKLEGKN